MFQYEGEKLMIDYDPDVIRGFADALYQRAANIVIINAAIFGVVGGAVGYGLNGGVTAVVGLAIGAGIGYYLGLQKTFLLKLQAQTALCQVKIEENTRRAA